MRNCNEKKKVGENILLFDRTHSLRYHRHRQRWNYRRRSTALPIVNVSPIRKRISPSANRAGSNKNSTPKNSNATPCTVIIIIFWNLFFIRRRKEKRRRNIEKRMSDTTFRNTNEEWIESQRYGHHQTRQVDPVSVSNKNMNSLLPTNPFLFLRCRLSSFYLSFYSINQNCLGLTLYTRYSYLYSQVNIQISAKSDGHDHEPWSAKSGRSSDDRRKKLNLKSKQYSIVWYIPTMCNIMLKRGEYFNHAGRQEWRSYCS